MSNLFFKMTIPVVVVLPLILSACGITGLDPDAMEVTLNTESSSLGGIFNRTDNILTIRSIQSEPLTVTKIDVNNGRCSYVTRYGKQVGLPAYFQIGQSLQLYLNCPYDTVIKVDIETDKGTASYRFK